jgi:hypothetical protein
MPRRYNLRSRDSSVKWVEDETLNDKEEDTDSEDEDYDPELDEEEEEEEEESEEEEEEEEEEDDDMSETSNHIRVPIPRYGRVKIEIDNRPVRGRYEDEDSEEEDEDEVEALEDDKAGFLGYLMNKYVPPSKIRTGKKKDAKEPEEAAMSLNEDEQEYYDDLPKSKQKKLNKQMKQR